MNINPKDISKLYANKKIYFNKLLNDGKIIIVKQNDKIKRGYIKLSLGKELDIRY